MANGITAEKNQRRPEDTPWWWLGGNTYPHRDLLKRCGARFSRRRKQWYFIGEELPDAIQALVRAAEAPTPAASTPPVLAPAPERQILAVLEQDDAACAPIAVVPQAESLADKPYSIRILKPDDHPTTSEQADAIEAAIRTAQRPACTPVTSSPSTPIGSGRVIPIRQAYCGKLTGSVTGQVFCYGYAVHTGICVYLNMGGPRMSVEAIRAKLSKGDGVTLVPDDAPAVELTAGEGNSGRYHAYLQTIPEARFTSLILLHDWVVKPTANGSSATFLFPVDEGLARAKLRQHVTQLVKLPVFDGWTDFLWTAGHAAGLVHPTRPAGGIDLLTVLLDAAAWTRLITTGIAQQAITLPIPI